MSQENVATVERFLRALDRGDGEDAAACLLSDAEWHNTAAFPESRTVVGPTAILEFWQTLRESFEPAHSRMEIENVTDVGGLVVVGVRSTGRGAGSGIPVEVGWALRVSMDDGKIRRVDVSGDYAKALKAAGLSE